MDIKKFLIFLVCFLHMSFIDSMTKHEWLNKNAPTILSLGCLGCLSGATGYLIGDLIGSKQKVSLGNLLSIGIPAASLLLKWGMDNLDAKYLGLSNAPQAWLRIKVGIKLATYGLLVSPLFKKNYPAALAVAGFCLLDSIATLPVSDLSFKIRTFMKNLKQKIDADVPLSFQKPKDETIPHKKLKFNTNLEPLCKIRRNKPDISIPFNCLTLLEDKFVKREKEEAYEMLLSDVYHSSCYITNLHFIFYPTLIESLLSSDIKRKLLRNKNKDLVKFVKPQLNCYRVVRLMGVEYFLGREEWNETWNKLPVELLFKIFSYVNVPNVEKYLDYCRVVAEYKKRSQDAQKKQALLPYDKIVYISCADFAELAMCHKPTITIEDLFYLQPLFDQPEEEEKKDNSAISIKAGSLEFETSSYPFDMMMQLHTSYHWWASAFERDGFINFYVAKSQGIYMLQNDFFEDHMQPRVITANMRKEMENNVVLVKVLEKSVENTEAQRGLAYGKEDEIITIKLLAINSSNVHSESINEDRNEALNAIKLDQKLYDALIWLAGKNSIIKLRIDPYMFFQILLEESRKIG